MYADVLLTVQWDIEDLVRRGRRGSDSKVGSESALKTLMTLHLID